MIWNLLQEVKKIEQILQKTRKINGETKHLKTGRLNRGKDMLGSAARLLINQREILAHQISSFYLISIAPLVIIDGKLTALGIKGGYYQGEFNPLINYLFGHFDIDTVFWLRAIFVIFAVMFLIYIYKKYPLYVKKYYLLLTLTMISYFIINIMHLWVLISVVV